MHPIKNIFFVGFSTIYLIIQSTRKLGFYIPEVLNSYVTDYLFIPLLLMFSLWLTRVVKRDVTIKLTLPMIVISVILISFIFEYYLPQTSLLYTADKIDVLMYLLGGVSYYYIQNRIFES